MQLIDRSNAGEIAGQNTAIALGTFDGLHVGHQELIRTLKSNAAGLKTMASTFSNIPASFFDNNKRLLFTPEEKTRTFEKLGLDYLFMEPFDEHIANMAPDDFARYLFDTLGAKLLVVGFNYTYGYKAGGNAEHLKSFAKRYGARVEIVSAINMLGEPVSSTRVRKALKDGDAELAEKLLGRPYEYVNTVEQGKHLGRTIGFPTVNFYPSDDKLSPRTGVYASIAEYNGIEYPAMTNIGVRPTVENTQRLNVETNIMGFNKDIYGQQVIIKLKHFIRPEQKFAGVEELKAQLTKDRQTSLNMLKMPLPQTNNQ